MSSMTGEDDVQELPLPEDLTLVMGMPRRELYGVAGFVTAVRYEVLESLQDESWFALPDILAEDLDAKEVRAGLLITRRDGRALVDEHGVLLHTTPIPAEVGNFGEGLFGIRSFARSAAAHFVSRDVAAPQLVGYLNCDDIPEVRPYFTLIYLVRCDEETDSPEGASWLSTASLAGLELEPASQALSEQADLSRLIG